MRPVLELILIHRWLRGHPHQDALRARLERALKGPWAEKDESPSTNSSMARNIAFELVCAAKMAQGGEVDLNDGDLAAAVDGARVNVECKRPRSAAGLPAAVKDAIEQLEKRARRHRGSVGLIAISGDLLMRSPSDIVKSESEEPIQRFYSDAARRIRREHGGAWRFRRSKAVHGVYVNVAGPAHARAPDKLFWAEGDLVHILRREAADVLLALTYRPRFDF